MYSFSENSGIIIEKYAINVIGKGSVMKKGNNFYQHQTCLSDKLLCFLSDCWHFTYDVTTLCTFVCRLLYRPISSNR